MEKCWSIIADMEPYTASSGCGQALCPGISGDINQSSLPAPHHQLSPRDALPYHTLITAQCILTLRPAGQDHNQKYFISNQYHAVTKPTSQLHILLNSDWVLGVCAPPAALRSVHCPVIVYCAWIFMTTKTLLMLLSRVQDDTKVVPSVRWIHNRMA